MRAYWVGIALAAACAYCVHTGSFPLAVFSGLQSLYWFMLAAKTER